MNGRNDFLRGHEDCLSVITSEIARIAADIRARYRLQLPDAFQIATALDAGCQAFLTNDAQLKRIAELKMLLVSELEA